MREAYLRDAIDAAIGRIQQLRPDKVLGLTEKDKASLKGFEKVELDQNYQDWVAWAFEEVKKLQQAGSIADDIIAEVAEKWRHGSKRPPEAQ
ncbi:MAG TPA: hypothetical protein EYP24_03745 [bacterium (Candidatus Stahlbacteria)]|nr:hypothetical protein [Candidatus Stahlbacteria bacterium]